MRLDDPSFGIVASGWYDTRLVGELLANLEQIADADDNDAWASTLAEAIAKDNVGGVYRSLFRLITTPAMLEANAQRVWRTYCDEGILVVNAPRAGELHLEIRYWTHHHAHACRVVGYAIQHVLRAVGYEALVIERTQCVSEGDTVCAFEGMYLPSERGRRHSDGTTERPRDHLVPQRVDLRLHVVRDRRRVRAVTHVPDCPVAQPEGVDPGLEAPLDGGADGVEHCDVAALHHAGKHRPRHLVVLVAIDTDGPDAALARRLEHPVTGRSGRVVNHVRAFGDLADGERLPLRGIAERIRALAGVGRVDDAVGTSRLHSRGVADLELPDERPGHPSDEADLMRLGDEAGHRPHQERRLFLAKVEPLDVRRGARRERSGGSRCTRSSPRRGSRAPPGRRRSRR